MLTKTRLLHAFWVLMLLAVAAKAAPFEPPSGLAAALQATLNNHPAIMGQQAEVQAQRYALDSTKAARYLSLSLQANDLNDEFTQSVVSISQPLWTFGRTKAAIAQAKAGVSAEQYRFQQVQRQLIEDAAAAYALVEGIQQRQQVALDNIHQQQDLYDSIARREAGQLATSADVQLANSRLIQAKATQLRTAGELHLALAELHAITQINVNSDQPIDRALITLPPSLDVQALAVKYSADILVKRERLNVARQEIQQQKVASRPTLAFRLEHSLSNSLINVDDTRAGFSFESRFEGLGFGNRGRVKSAVARAEAARHDLNVTVNEVKRRTNSLMLNREVQQTLIQAQHEAVNALVVTLASFQRQYENGRKSWLELLNTQRELTELRLQLAQMETEWLVLSLRVATQIGKLDEQAGMVAL